MPLTDVPSLEASVDIDATPATVWGLVGDPRNMARWSPQTWRSFHRDKGEVRLGSHFRNINRRGLLVWPTSSKVVRFTPEQEIAWRVKDNYTVWSLRLAPNAEGGTTLTQSREAPDGLSDVSVRLTKLAMGGVENFATELQRDMATTLAQIKADAERA